VTPKEKWQLIRGAHGLWAMYENACVVLEMADYSGFDSALIRNKPSIKLPAG
jgi:hypothetical protein